MRRLENGVAQTMSSTTTNSPNLSAARSESDGDHELAQIRESLRGLKFGTVTIVVQDGVVVQIDRTEKRRVRPATAR
jgi:hypothetical protein